VSQYLFNVVVVVVVVIRSFKLVDYTHYMKYSWIMPYCYRRRQWWFQSN